MSQGCRIWVGVVDANRPWFTPTGRPGADIPTNADTQPPALRLLTQMARAAFLGYALPMPDDLYDRDVLAWSRHQADLLRRLSRGERVNEVDWEHVIEEIEDVGLSQLNAVQSYLRLVLVHLLKVHGWPDSPSIGHWRGEIVSFQADAAQRFAPSMRQKIDLDRLYGIARAQISVATYDGRSGLLPPEACPFTLDQLLTGHAQALEATFGRPTADPA